jgi:DNA-binding SARP family transcriptional activator
VTAPDAPVARAAVPGVLLRLLGPVRLEVDGTDRTPLGPLLRGLLAALGCARGHAVPAETLAAVLGQLGADTPQPGEAGDTGLLRADPAQVQVHLARLADVLGPAASYLTRTGGGVRLSGPGLLTDLDTVDEAVEAGRAAATGGDGAGAATALRRALARWPGPVADDLPGVEALTGVRAHYARLRPDVVEELAESELRDGSLLAAQVSVRELEAHVAAHPERERGWGLLVEALYLAGRPVEALQAVRRATAATSAPADRHDRDEVLRGVERAALRRSRMPQARAEGRRPSLVWVDAAGSALSRALPATGSVLVGRDAGADVPLGDPTVSRTHAAVLRWENGWTLLDLGSRDGTTLNGRAVTDGTPLRPGDVVRCGDVVLLVADSRSDGLPEDGRESGGAADLRDATALAGPLVVDLDQAHRPVG